MQLSDFDFVLPPELIARYPLANRSDSRLLQVQGEQGMISHHTFKEVLQLVREGDLLVFNDTKVIPARLLGHKSTGGQVEVLVERILDEKRIRAQMRVSKSPAIGEEIFFTDGIRLVITNKQQQFYELCYEAGTAACSVLTVIEKIGHIPLPPYLQRMPDDNDKMRYQTVYARHQGSIAAPTAGFHFDTALLQQLQAKKVEIGYLTLHIGAGTFSPVRTEIITEHEMHPEYLEINTTLCEQIKTAKARGNRVIAVGTTTLRALETAYQSGEINPYQGETSLFIYPGYVFRSADVLITNLHLPRSSLLMLVCAFGGYQAIMQAYHVAVAQQYRFYSYGDAMWIKKASSAGTPGLLD